MFQTESSMASQPVSTALTPQGRLRRFEADSATSSALIYSRVKDSPLKKKKKKATGHSFATPWEVFHSAAPSKFTESQSSPKSKLNCSLISWAESRKSVSAVALRLTITLVANYSILLNCQLLTIVF